MSTPLPQLPQDAKASICRMLRTKTAFGCCDVEETPWQEGESTTAVYWCLGTMETAGPDNVYCHPSTCVAGRSCYRSEPE